MARSRHGVGLAFLVPGLIAAAGLLATGQVRADRISLRGGGQVRGKVTADPDKPGSVIVITERGKTPLHFQKAQIVAVIAEPSPLDEYVNRKARAARTAEDQYNLGLWCEQRKLSDLAEVHYEAAVGTDPSYAPAHEKLGHVLIGDRWLGGDALREARGLVKYKGRWITPEERDQQEQTAASLHELNEAVRRIRQLRDAFVNSAGDRHREAESQLMATSEPAMVKPLMRALANDIDPVRSLLAHVLGAIPGEKASSALVSLFLAEAEPDVRHTIFEQIDHRKEPDTAKQLVKALRSSNPAVINRAAWALANLNVVSAVPSLVGALISTKTEVVLAPSASDGSSIAASFGASPASVSPYYGALAGYNGSTAAYLTGPVVAPGVVAYGAASVPMYGMMPPATIPGPYMNPGATVGIAGGGGLNASRGPVPRLLTIKVQNTEVLEALKRLTGRDFGYDATVWREWIRSSFEVEKAPVRTVPQP